MTMKCLYAIPEQHAAEARSLCEKYDASLKALSSNALVLAGDLRAFAESLGAPALKVDDEDWAAAHKQLEVHGESALCGEIFWANDAARRAHIALGGITDSALSVALAGWLATQVKRNRAVVLLTC
jgi:hypothetical protein